MRRDVDLMDHPPKGIHMSFDRIGLTPSQKHGLAEWETTSFSCNHRLQGLPRLGAVLRDFIVAHRRATLGIDLAKSLGMTP